MNDPPPGNCANTQAYFADVTGFGMVVYDAASDSSWRVENSAYIDIYNKKNIQFKYSIDLRQNFSN